MSKTRSVTNKVIPVLNLAKNDDDLRTDVFELLQKANIRTDRGFVLTPLLDGNSKALVHKIDNQYESYVLKMFLYQEDMQATKTFYTLAQKNNLPVPRVYLTSSPSQLVPFANLLMEWIPYRQMKELPKAQLRKTAMQAGVLLRKIHRIETDGFGSLSNRNEWLGKDNKWLCKAWINRINQISQPEISGMLPEILEKTILSKELQSFSKPVLIHGDFCPRNIFVNKIFGDEITIIGLIDPAEFVSGDPMSDLSFTQNTCYSEIYRQNLLDGYTMTGALSEEECDRLYRWRLFRQFIATCNAIRLKRDNTQDLMNDLLIFLKTL